MAKFDRNPVQKFHTSSGAACVQRFVTALRHKIRIASFVAHGNSLKSVFMSVFAQSSARAHGKNKIRKVSSLQGNTAR